MIKIELKYEPEKKQWGISEFLYDEIIPIEGYPYIKVKARGKFGVVGLTAKNGGGLFEVFPCEYDDIRFFNGRYYILKKDGKWGVKRQDNYFGKEDEHPLFEIPFQDTEILFLKYDEDKNIEAYNNNNNKITTILDY